MKKKCKQSNDSCPKCYQTIRLYTDAMIEGRGVRVIYTCEQCRFRWLARSYYNNAIVRHEMVSYEQIDGAHRVLGYYK